MKMCQMPGEHGHQCCVAAAAAAAGANRFCQIHACDRCRGRGCGFCGGLGAKGAAYEQRLREERAAARVEARRQRDEQATPAKGAGHA